MEYKKTLNLPKTDFPMRANLKTVEETFLLHWDEIDLYQKILKKNYGNKTYILHDGPPYANGHIHLGHSINRILKDIVVKYKNMSGLYAPFKPGWDCHGLPIETQLIKELGSKRKDMEVIEFRKKCYEYALKFVHIQKTEFTRLGLIGDWENPYLTLNPVYEEKVIDVFGKLAEKGYVYRGLKPIHWCPTCETALAEAEIEYEDEKSPSIFVKFAVRDQNSMKFDKRSPLYKLNLPVFFIIWTTTPWTLPANVAIAAHPRFEYVFVRVKDEVWVIAEGLLDTIVEKLGLKDHKIIDKVKGEHLEGILCKHPFFERDSVLVLDEYVTLEQGTGLVHIAPGHGEEDYKVGLKYKLPIIMPVDSKGYFDNTVGEFSGKHYDEANKLITARMKENGTLLKLEFMKHSYPHCWRCKKPVIFRATEQWFISVDKNDLRGEALKAVANTDWIPSWGENRIRGMLETRPDWCISRQRSWGVPIPAFYCEKCGKVHFTGAFNEAAKELIRGEGADGWFKKEAQEILPKDLKCDCGGKSFRKETDILDVWFESGSSHVAVLETSDELSWPADLYLEGSDQHRGWFQTSLLTSVGCKGRAPFNAVLTHGFTIDDKGKKMSKSQGNVISPQDVVKKYGADVLRLWVASTDFRNDMAASDKILRQVQEAYIKIRNTCRFLLSNLGDYEKPLPYEKLLEIDKWILLKLFRLGERVTKAYEDFEFHLVYHKIYDFCVNDLSSFYLDISKDRLYCGGKNSLERRSAQTVMLEILKTLILLSAPILSFTAEDIFRYLKQQVRGNYEESVFLYNIPKPNADYFSKALEEKWDQILSVREEVYKALEEARKNKVISSSTEAKVEIFKKDKTLKLLQSMNSDLPMIFIVSEVILKEGEGVPRVIKAPGNKCKRCWLTLESVGTHSDHPTLCDRCHSVVTTSW